MFSAFSLLVSASILFYVLRYRVHVHLEYTPVKKAHARKTVRQPAPRSIALDAPGDLVSALRNLGCTPGVARQAAARANRQASDFDTALKLAIRYATEKAA